MATEALGGINEKDGKNSFRQQFGSFTFSKCTLAVGKYS